MARVLVIDDEAGVRQMIAALLSAAGHDVCQAADGHEGETRAETFVPDVAIVDIVMPRREGLETIQALRQGWPALKILAISGGGRLGALEYLAIASHFGADGVLAKPFDRTQLLAMLESLRLPG